MSNNTIKQELYDVLSGKIKIRNGEPLQAIACYLRASQETSVIAKNAKQFQREAAQRLKALNCVIGKSKILFLPIAIGIVIGTLNYVVGTSL